MSDTPPPIPPADTKPVTTVVEKTAGQPSVTTTTSVLPGWKTSEFWTTMVVVMAGAIMAIFGTIKDKDSATQNGMILMGFSGGAYAISRGLAKKSS